LREEVLIWNKNNRDHKTHTRTRKNKKKEGVEHMPEKRKGERRESLLERAQRSASRREREFERSLQPKKLKKKRMVVRRG